MPDVTIKLRRAEHLTTDDVIRWQGEWRYVYNVTRDSEEPEDCDLDFFADDLDDRYVVLRIDADPIKVRVVRKATDDGVRWGAEHTALHAGTYDDQLVVVRRLDLFEVQVITED